MSSDAPKEARPIRPWLRILLFVSLAVNLLILGAVAGALLGKDGRGKSARKAAAPVEQELGLGPYVRALSNDDRQALVRDAQSRAPEFHDRRQRMRATFTETLDVLRAESFDGPRLRALIETQARLAEGGRQAGKDLLLARIETMSLVERRALADRLEVAVRHRGSRRHGRPPEPGPDR